jgi:alkylation response protein AidB-like acyl-CoA dehydrogenase
MSKETIKGAEFIIRETKAQDIFIPEQFSEEQKMIEQMCKDFLKTDVHPYLDKIDSMTDPEMMPNLVEKAGALGLLGLTVPEDLGGMGLDFLTSMLATEALGPGHSFSVAYGAHTGIGTLPLLYYGNDQQKK